MIDPTIMRAKQYAARLRLIELLSDLGLRGDGIQAYFHWEMGLMHHDAMVSLIVKPTHLHLMKVLLAFNVFKTRHVKDIVAIYITIGIRENIGIDLDIP